MSKFFRILFVISFSILSVLSARAQYISLGNDPIDQKWNIIKTDHYKLIYPREIDSLARLYLWNLEANRELVYNPMLIDPRPISVILHSHTTQSNGMVTWAPKRIELFSSPDPYSSEPDSWIEHLTKHEMRHVAQVEHYTRDFYDVFYYLLGDQVTGLGLAILVSNYLLEGDAVIAETELSKSGRGRSADFLKLMRTLYLNGEFRSWDRLNIGSKRDYAPNHYDFGYNYLSYIRYTTGRYDVIGDFFMYPSKYWYDIPILAETEPAVIGYHLDDAFRRGQKTLAAMWKEDDLSRGEFTSYSILKEKKDRLYVEMSSPIHIDNPDSPYHGSTIAVKWGMATTYKMIAIDSEGKERFIRFFNPTASRLTYDGKDKIYWTEAISADAADLQDFSEIYSFNVVTGKVERITKRTKYFNPAISEDGKTAAVAEYPIIGSTFLVTVDLENGNVLSRIEAPFKAQIKEPVFVGNELLSSIITQDGISVYKWDGAEWIEVIKPQHQSIIGLRSIHDTLYFTSDVDGLQNIYTFDLENDKLTRITNSKYGADYAYIHPGSGRLYYSEYGMPGFRAAVSEPQDRDTTVKSFDSPYRFPMAEVMAGQTEKAFKANGVAERTAIMKDTLDIFNTKKYPAKKYNKVLNSICIHSWAPLYYNIDNILSFSGEHFTHLASLGATVLSQNMLGTTVMGLSYGYIKDVNTGKYFHSGHFNLDTRIWGNLKLEFNFDVNNRNSFVYIPNPEGMQYIDTPLNTVVNGMLYEMLDKPLLQAYTSLSYPVDFNSNGWFRTLTPLVRYTFRNDRYLSYDNTTLSYHHGLDYGITYGQTLPTAKSQMFPRWGFGAIALGSSIIEGGNNFGPLMYLHGYAYFPGITRQQGIKLTLSYQQQFLDDKLYYYPYSYAALPRGYSLTPDGQRIFPKEQYFCATLDYAIPIPLGDFSLGPVLYVQRLKLTPFVDYALNMWNDKAGRHVNNYWSFGIDAMVDFYAFRFILPLSIGFRYAHTNPNQSLQQHTFELLFNIEI